jgi:pyruvate/2-oxoglutarate dehydrogenase complex dihydrolipoamide acyltransferase (E2) component
MSSVEFRLPDVGEGIHEAEIVKWLVQEGERVQEFDPIVEVQTDKALVELPAPASGYIGEIVATTGSLAKVGDVIVVIEKSPQSVAVKSQTVTGKNQTVTANSQAENGESASLYRPKATPGVRYYARQQGVELTDVSGTGPGGRILKSDVDQHQQKSSTRTVMQSETDTMARQSLLWNAVRQSDRPASKPRARVNPEAGDDGDTLKNPLYASANQGLTESFAQRSGTRVPFRGIRRATAEHVKRSAFTAPHVTAFDECDATELVALRTRWNEALKSEGQRVSYLPFLVKATVSALKAFPYFNARLDEAAQEIELLPNYHVGIAVDTPEGLFVPVIRHVDALTVRQIGEEIFRLTQGVRQRTLSQEDLRGSTFTITNMGPIGGLFATPILNFPEVGILAVHQIQRKPVARHEQVVIRDVLTLSLSFDHRVIDGATSVRFLNHMKHLIENPDMLMLELK